MQSSASRSSQLEKILLAGNASLFLQNYLVHLYPIIDAGQLKLILAPTNNAMARLASHTGKTIEQIAKLDVGVELLANHVSQEALKMEGLVAYRALNGEEIKHDLLAKMSMIDGHYMDGVVLNGLSLIIVDNIIYTSQSQLTNLKNFQLITNNLTVNNNNNLLPYPDDCVIEDTSKYGQPADASESCDKDENNQDLDSLTYVSIEPNNLTRVRCRGKLYCYHINTLKTMLENDPKDPFTRTEFSEEFKQGILANYGKINKTQLSMVIPNALRRLDSLFEPVERVLDYSQKITPLNKRGILSHIDDFKNNQRTILNNPVLDELSRVYTVFGDDEEPGPAITYAQRVGDRVRAMEFQ